MNRRHTLAFILIMIVCASIWQLGLAGWIHTKAIAAQLLLDHAWNLTLVDKQKHRPWPWADTWPVAQLIVPDHDIDQIILAGDSGATLAFGPGHSFGSARPGEDGTVLISGHRDTHFQFLQAMKQGERILVKTQSNIYYYRVSETRIVDSLDYKVDTTIKGLILSTCYPFNSALFGGTERYLVFAEHENII